MRAAALRWLADRGIAKRAPERLVVFVSHGGTCRCAMAKVIAQDALSDRALAYPLKIESMASGIPNLATASEGARNAIKDMFGVDLLADHRPRG